MEIKKSDLIDTYVQSRGMEPAKELITKKINAASLKNKESYTVGEVGRICGELMKDGGLIEIIAHNFLIQLESRKSEEQTLLLDNIETQIWYLTDIETYGAVNKARAEFLGMEKSNVEYRNIYELVSGEEAEVCIANNREVFKRKKQTHMEEWVRDGEGKARLLSITRTPKLDGNRDVEYVICAAENITKRKWTDDALRESEERYRTIFENAKDIIVTLDLRGKITTVNKRVEEVGGYKKEDLLGKNIARLKMFPLKSLELILKNFAKRMVGVDVPPYEVELMTKDKKKLFVEIDAKALRKEDRIVGDLIILRDITTRKNVENALRKERDKAQQYLDVVGVLLIVVDANRKVTLINKKGCEILGYNEEEIIDKDYFDNFIPKRVREEVKVNVFNKLITGRTKLIEYYENPVLTESGEERIIAWHNAVLKDEQGRIYAILCSGEDITKRKQMEEVLREDEEKLSQIVQGSSLPTFVIDNRHIITHWNNACENLTGVSANEVIGTQKQWSAFYSMERPVMADIIVNELGEEEIAKHYDSKYRKSTLTEGAYEAEDFFPDLGEKGKWLFFTAAPLGDIKGNVIGAIETLQDITERKKAEERLRENINELERFNKMMIGRELRMIELKKEINTLLEESGENPRYKVPADEKEDEKAEEGIETLRERKKTPVVKQNQKNEK